MIHFNKPENSEKRQNTIPLSLEEENKAIAFVNELLTKVENSAPSYGGEYFNSNKELLQRFVNHYQNLNHHMVSTVGLWATDKFPAVHVSKDMFFKIEF